MNKLKKYDIFIILAIVLLVILGAITAFGLHKFGKSPVQAEQPVAIQVMFKNLVISDDSTPFVVDEDAFITIRNVPYTSLKILDVTSNSKKVVVSANNKQGYLVVDDASSPMQYDFIVTLKDTVKVTNDGEYVVGGNKLKVGLPIILEGKDYRFNGIISSLKPIEETSQVNDGEAQ